MARIHPFARTHAQALQTGHLSRREFLARVTALGIAAPSALALIGERAAAQGGPAPVRGGTLRMQMATLPLCDPRLADWPEIGNVLRGWLEPLVNYTPDGGFEGVLLQDWEMNDTATTLTLRVRRGISWSNGDPLIAEHIRFNLRRWADGGVPGNGMAALMRALQSEGRLDEDAVTVKDDHTLHLTLRHPDATLIAAFSEYTALVVHPSYDGADPAVGPLGTGPYLPVENEVGTRQVLERDAARPWWGTAVFGGPWLDRIEYIDSGAGAARSLDFAQRNLIDAVDQSVGDAVPQFDGIGWVRSEVASAATLAVRFRQDLPQFSDRRIRRALQQAVSNVTVRDIAAPGMTVGENHHVAPVQPDYAPLPPTEHDPEGALALLQDSLTAPLTLVSLDDAWQALTCDAVAAQLNDAGIAVERKIEPGHAYWPQWRDYPFSGTSWTMRPLGVQVLQLAYRSGAAWNETGFANDAFDADLDTALGIADPDARKVIMARLERTLQDEGVLIQPFWRTLMRHTSPRVHGADIQPTLVHRHHEWWIDPPADAP
ncbi:ABC transporter substrate-binding protein [Falsirhodobacter halotolerans]|uniref:ABC transporter substrate-binding protein n=1 Tax=Falsirhodobacter halotolerans TaxID=1146892 RepID=UPI001FD50B9A|nr:ABC transporter substrate-binding protein [Falsirhodobacter halotolerans]MCJ8139653.1 ABC transporter substrate-binding protein [Falsirhodobacter halotolerans]